jgi:hypothetical protein
LLPSFETLGASRLAPQDDDEVCGAPIFQNIFCFIKAAWARAFGA